MAEPTEGSPAAAPPQPGLPAWQRYGIIATGAVVLLLVVAVVVVKVVGGDDDAGSPTGTGDEQVISDDFERDDDTVLGTATTGETWSELLGRFGVEGGEAVVVAPNEQGPRSLAVLESGSRDGRVEAEIGEAVQGWGIVFRQRDRLNYWFVSAAPGYGTYNVGRLVNGELVGVGDIGLAKVAPGTVVSVTYTGTVIQVSIDGQVKASFTDEAADTGGGGVGLLANGESASTASWRSFTTVPTPPVQVPPTPTATPAVDGSTAPTTAAPSTDVPTTGAPTTEPPSTEPPSTDAPTTEAP